MQDQVFVPKTRSQVGLPPLDPAKEDLVGRNVTNEVKEELREALGDSPIGATLLAMGYLVGPFFFGRVFFFCWTKLISRSLGGLRISLEMRLDNNDIPRALVVCDSTYFNGRPLTDILHRL